MILPILTFFFLSFNYGLGDSMTERLLNLSAKVELRCQSEPKTKNIICACHGENVPVLQTLSKSLCGIMVDTVLEPSIQDIRQTFPIREKIYFESSKKFRIVYTGDSKMRSSIPAPSGLNYVKVDSGIGLCTSSCAKLDPFIESGMVNIEGVQCRINWGELSCTCNAATKDVNIETTLLNLIKKGISKIGEDEAISREDYIAGLKTFGIHHCPSMLDVKLDFNEVKEAYPSLKKIYFEEVSSIKAIFSGFIQHGDMNVEFRNIRRSTSEDRAGYAILSGTVGYCIDPCSKATPTSDALPPWKRTECSECDPDSHLNIKFDNVAHILLDGVALANYGESFGKPEYGGATFSASNVKTLRAETAYLMNVEDLGTYADLCWRVGKTGRRGEVEDREVSCSSLFPSDADWPWWYYVIGVVLTMILCPCFCFFACAAWAVIKGCYDGCCEPETILNADVSEVEGWDGGPRNSRNETEMKPMNPSAPSDEIEPPSYEVACES